MLFQINHIHKYPYLTHYIAPCISFNSYDTRDLNAFEPLGTNYFCISKSVTFWNKPTLFEKNQTALRLYINIIFDVVFQRTLKKTKNKVKLLTLCFHLIDGFLFIS